LRVLGLVVAFNPGPRLQRWLLRARHGVAPEAAVGCEPPPYPGLIALSSLGRGIRATECAIRYHYRGLHDERPAPTLRHAWVLTCGEGSHAQAEQMRERLEREHGLPPAMVELVELGEDAAHDPRRVYEAVERIYQSAGAQALGPSNLICDYTAGTGSMSAGMLLAGSQPGRRLQFMQPERLLDNGKPDPAALSHPRTVDVTFRVRPGR
jgi:hypothetical protein